MKTKKIWIWAIVFGILTTVSLYFALFYDNTSQPIDENVEVRISQEDSGNGLSSQDQNDVNLDQDVAQIEETGVLKQQLPEISEGKRVISINIGEAQGVQGFIKAGDYVDIVALTPSKEGWAHDDEAQIFLQNIKVLAVGHATDEATSAANYKAVTLEVTPEEGLQLTLAQFDGQLYLMLRKEGDNGRLPDYIHIHADQLHLGGHLTR